MHYIMRVSSAHNNILVIKGRSRGNLSKEAPFRPRRKECRNFQQKAKCWEGGKTECFGQQLQRRCSEYLAKGIPGACGKDAEKGGKWCGMRLKRQEGRRSHTWKTATQRSSHPICKVPDVSLIVLGNQVPKILTSATVGQAHLHYSSLGNIPRHLETWRAQQLLVLMILCTLLWNSAKLLNYFSFLTHPAMDC